MTTSGTGDRETEHYLGVIERLNPKIDAVMTVTADMALLPTLRDGVAGVRIGIPRAFFLADLQPGIGERVMEAAPAVRIACRPPVRVRRAAPAVGATGTLSTPFFKARYNWAGAAAFARRWENPPGSVEPCASRMP